MKSLATLFASQEENAPAASFDRQAALSAQDDNGANAPADEPAPEELLQSATVLPRQSPDADLRAALIGATVESSGSTSQAEAMPMFIEGGAPLACCRWER